MTYAEGKCLLKSFSGWGTDSNNIKISRYSGLFCVLHLNRVIIMEIARKAVERIFILIHTNFLFLEKTRHLFFVLYGSVVQRCSTYVMFVFRWYSRVFCWLFRCFATVPGCSAVSPVFRFPFFRCFWFYSMPREGDLLALLSSFTAWAVSVLLQYLLTLYALPTSLDNPLLSCPMVLLSSCSLRSDIFKIWKLKTNLHH